QELTNTTSAPGLMFEAPDVAMEYVPSYDTPPPDVVPANDPQFQTVFSPTATYEPPGDRDLSLGEYVAPPEPALPDIELENFAAPPSPAEFDRLSVPDFTTLPPPPPPPISMAPVASPTAFGSEAGFSPAPANAAMTAKMNALFHAMAEVNASDLHLSVSMPPMIRKDGKIQPLKSGEQAISGEMMRSLLTSIMPPSNQEEFGRRHDTDFAYEMAGLARFRCNVFMDRKGMGGVFRIIPAKMTTAEQLGLSPAILGLCDLSKGLVVVTGPTGSGKSTTLCAMVNHINTRREDHIITIEDPIEFVHDNYKCLVNQREVHNHTESFKDALRAALREDPDILLVGEMRDLETISIAIETAETGHLVFGTLHTTTAASTVDRIIDQFPADRQQQIRVMLSESLKGVIAQTLLPKKGGGRVAALEVLVVTPAISNLIREGKTFQIPSAMQTGRTHGMVMLNDSLFEHVQKGTVEPLDAYIKAVDKPGFEAMLTRGGFKL
ncbi:MAG TPA: type IV pilus twitching motility protein PilT, partial [Pyrinomonadaceae bacterium]|nr:type IV pilus twitching motility protein PilT [Pyrinomonadaceae bacterium]